VPGELRARILRDLVPVERTGGLHYETLSVVVSGFYSERPSFRAKRITLRRVSIYTFSSYLNVKLWVRCVRGKLRGTTYFGESKTKGKDFVLLHHCHLSGRLIYRD